jgi:hypothetical protein
MRKNILNVRQKQSDVVLNHIKEHLSEIEELYRVFQALEEDYIYRFYHQSYKVFGATD